MSIYKNAVSSATHPLCPSGCLEPWTWHHKKLTEAGIDWEARCNLASMRADLDLPLVEMEIPSKTTLETDELPTYRTQRRVCGDDIWSERTYVEECFIPTVSRIDADLLAILLPAAMAVVVDEPVGMFYRFWEKHSWYYADRRHPKVDAWVDYAHGREPQHERPYEWQVAQRMWEHIPHRAYGGVPCAGLIQRLGGARHSAGAGSGAGR